MKTSDIDREARGTNQTLSKEGWIQGGARGQVGLCQHAARVTGQFSSARDLYLAIDPGDSL